MTGLDVISGVLPPSGASMPKEDAPPEEVELFKKEENRDARSSFLIESGQWRLGHPFKAPNATDEIDKPERSKRAFNKFSAVVDAAAQAKAKENGFSRQLAARRSVSVPAGGNTIREKNKDEDSELQAHVHFADTVKILAAKRAGSNDTNSPKLRRHAKMVRKPWLRLATSGFTGSAL